MRNDFPDFDEKKELYEKISQKEEQLKKELEKINSDQQIYLNRINEIEVEAEALNEKIEKSKNEEGAIKEKDLQISCSQTVEQFLKDVNLQGIFSLSIIIEYEQMKIFKNLTEKDMTFGKLKEETQMQFGKEANEFYFGDVNNNIYPDELRVIPALFPLSLVKVDKYEPTIIVIDKDPIKKKLNGDALGKLEEMDKLEEEQTEVKKKTIITKRVLFICLNAFFVIFIGVWSQCCINYMFEDDFKVYKHTYFGKFNPLMADFPVSDFSQLKNKIESFVTSSDLNLTTYDPSIFNVDINYDNNNNDDGTTTSTPPTIPDFPYNYVFKKGMFIPKVGESNEDCGVGRLKFNLGTNANCYSTYEEVEIKSNMQKNDASMQISGELKTYSTKSYGIQIDLENPSSISLSVIDPKALEAFFLMFNLYNRNLNSVVTLTILFEKLNDRFHPKAKLQMLPIANSVDAFYIVSIIFAVLIILNLFLLLANENRPPQRIVFDEKGNQQLTKSIPAFRLPKFHEWLLIFNLLFYIAIIIFRVTFKTNFKLEEALESTDFQNLVKYEDRFDVLNGISFLNLVISYFLLVFFLYNLYPEKLKDLSNTISGYIYDLGGFILFIIIPFIFMSFFTSYILFGSFGYAQYNNLAFIFLKVIQNIFRGSLDHSDYMSQENKEKLKLFKGFETTINYTDDLINATGSSGFILYSMIFFFFSFIVIKGSIIAVCILKYKLIYVGRLEKEEKDRKEQELKERKRKRMENQKSAKLKKDEISNQKTEPQNIEMVEIK